VDFTYLRLLVAIISLFSITFLGVWFRKRNVMKSDADPSLHWLLINLFTPCLIIDAFLTNAEIISLKPLLTAPILGFTTAILGLIISGIFARNIPSGESKRAFCVCTSFYNYGYLPIPIVLIFFNISLLKTLFLFNIGLDIALWTLGFGILTGKGNLSTSLRRIGNPPFYAILFSLTITYLYKENPFPNSISSVIHMSGQAAIPVALLALGGLIYDHRRLIRPQDNFKTLFSAVALRLLLIPLCFVGILYTVSLPAELKIILSIQTGMPSAILPTVIISRYGGDFHLALRILVTTSLFALFTTPAWLSFLLTYTQTS